VRVEYMGRGGTDVQSNDQVRTVNRMLLTIAKSSDAKTKDLEGRK
jgi:hypothetical protein